MLASSLDVRATMHQVVGLLVPRLADLCAIDVLADDGAITGVGVASSETALAGELEGLRRRFPIDPAGDHPVARAIRSGEPQFIPAIDQTYMRSFGSDEMHVRFMIEHDYRSAIVAPLVARGRILGALSALRLGAGTTSYGSRDVELIAELARRAALAIDNATLYSRLSRAEQRLDAIFASVGEAITVVDARGRVTFANQAAADLLGRATPELLVGAESAELIAQLDLRDEQGAAVPADALPEQRLLRGEPVAPLLVQSVARETGRERWLIVRSSPIPEVGDAGTGHVVNVFDDITEVKRAELGEKFMAEASRLLVSSSDYGPVLGRVARLAVPTLADWCAIDLVERSAGTVRVAIHARDGAPAAPDELASGAVPGPIADVIRTGTSIVATEVDALAAGPLQARGTSAVVVVPIVGAAAIVGAVSLVSFAGGRRLGAVDLAIAERLARRIGTAVERARLNTERAELARTLQRALLPGALPAIPGIELEARYLAAGEVNEVGGDFYDVIDAGRDAVILVIGDVCGKGARAAGVTALARHTLRAAAIVGQPLEAMLVTLHEALQRHSTQAELCTVCLAEVAPRATAAHVTIALAGHPPPLIIDRDGAARYVGTPGTLLGVTGSVRPGLARIGLERGETLLLYTDGVIDAGRPDNQLGEQGLLDLISGIRVASLADLLERVERIALERSGGVSRDDLALLGLRRAPPA